MSKSGTNSGQWVESRFVVVDAGNGSVNSDQQQRRRSLVDRRTAQLGAWLVVQVLRLATTTSLAGRTALHNWLRGW
ncbi:hypothetical protein ACFX11_040431 [Malus domestica]